MVRNTINKKHVTTIPSMLALKYIALRNLKQILVIPPLDHPYKRPVKKFIKINQVFLCPLNMVSGQQVEYIIHPTPVIFKSCTLDCDLK